MVRFLQVWITFFVNLVAQAETDQSMLLFQRDDLVLLKEDMIDNPLA